ncbi:magnesium/cobalt transporter CorA [Brumimicrobium oceani]|uniref:Magnesium transport protein CorA n=1 Tax=Brumimicrobium oceani TaxID=2100725 RepID=A0A2U2XGD4_9FLAO|nr:magnesium/cobalt transporter CorA [Brumimicrobium oceani]PWH86823.1 magnesium and cobalt transport protein CorA [Brumimicrobium oceani]
MKHKQKKKRKKNNRIKKTGMAPGMFLFTGEQKTDKTTFQVINFDENEIEENSFDNIEAALAKVDQTHKTSWLNIDGLHETDNIKRVVEHFNLHKLSGEDILSIGQRPKLDDYEHYVHIVAKMFSVNNEEIEDEQVTIIFADRLLITFQEKQGDVFNGVRERLFDAVGQIRTRKSDYLAYALLDSIVDNYFITIEHFGDLIEELEIELLEDPSDEILPRLHEVRRQASYLRRSVFPLRETVSRFEKLELPYMFKETKFFIRDLHDHTVQVIETVTVFKDAVGGLLDLYMSSVSNRMNNVMKVLTIVSTIFIPLTFIAGVYGMNFGNMPELQYKYGYHITMIAMAVLTLLMIFYFKRKKWL